jgi:hypothetical protein
MEQYCFAHPGTFCFSRPLYADASSKPTLLEYGVLKAGELWVEIFENHYSKPGETCPQISIGYLASVMRRKSPANSTLSK